MDSRTSEIYENIDIETMKKATGEQITPSEAENMIVVEDGFFSPEEIKRGHAGFESFCKAIGINPTTRQVKRKAERMYAKALKNLVKKRG